MLAYALTSLESPPELLEVPRPTLGQDDVLIRVQVSSINPVDDLVATGFFRTVQEYRFPAVFGRDVCGVVEAVGDRVSRLRVGQTVWGFVKRPYIGDGTFAEYVSVPADYFVAPKPDGLTVMEAGTMGLASVTALECLDALDLSPGDTVFVNRATGGVGSFAVQIAAARGLRVIATARPGSAQTYIRNLGATDVVDWTGGDPAAAVRAIAPEGADGLVDLVRRDTSSYIGMDETASQQAMAEFAAAVLRPGGRFSSVTNGASADLLERGIGFNVHSEPTLANLNAINALAATGALRSPVTAAYPFARIAEGFQRQREAGLGKTAVALDPALQASQHAIHQAVRAQG
jgi:NADPH:quinone reductase-like Zn-dependent oxidoreductase